MAFDGITTKAVITELQQTLIGGKINKIFQPTKNEIILNIYNQSNYTLLLSANPDYCRIHLTSHTKPNPQNAPNFCMLLRKYLIGAKIIEISNYDLERTVQIKFETYNELNDLVIRKLFVQIMNRQSNIILTNENNIIIDSLKHFENALPAHPFEFTKITKKSFLELPTQNDLTNLINHENLMTILPDTFIGFSKSFVKNLLNFLNINPADYSETNVQKIYETLQTICSNFGTNQICVKLFEDDYSILPEISQTTINTSIDEFYYEKEQKTAFISSRNNLLRIVLRKFKKSSQKIRKYSNKITRMPKHGHISPIWRTLNR